MMNSFKEELTSFLNSPIKTLCFESIDSTNNEAKRLVKSGEKENLLIVAKEQTSGRGRQGKSFYSPKDTGIYFTAVFNESEKSPLTLTVAAAVSVCRAVEKLTGKTPQIKWVNDIYLNGKKVCGILAEAVSEGKDINAYIIGVGINLTTPAFPESVENGGNLGFSGSTAQLVAETVNELYKTAFAPAEEYIDYYRSRSMLLGKEIYLIENNKKTPAIALGISETGALKVKLENGEIREISSGEVSVRKKE